MSREKTITVFFDTEFTNLNLHINPHVVPKLISVGLVSLDGREFYAELSDTYQIGDCSDFVIKNVLPLLQGGEYRLLEAQCASKLQVFIESLGEGEVVLRSDAPGYDWPLLEYMFNFYGCWPKNLRRKCGTVYFDNHNLSHRYRAGVNDFWKTNGARQHHALVDARCMRFAWRFAIRRGG